MSRMNRWRPWIVVAGTACVAVAGISLLVAVSAEVNGDHSAEVAPVAKDQAAPPPVRSERISPPGAHPMPPRPPASLPRPRAERAPDDIGSPTFRLGGVPQFPGAPGEFPGMEEGDGELQKQLATRRLAALERRVRAINRRVESMGDRGSTPEQIEAQKGRMEALLEEIRAKREEMGLPSFQMDEPPESAP